MLGLNDVFTMNTPQLTTTPLGTAAAQPARSCSLSSVPYLCTYNPTGLQTAYDATSAPTGSGTTEAIFAEGDLTQVVADLRQEESDNGLPEVPVTVDQTGAASTDTSGADEWDMDTQYSTGMAQDVKGLILYDAASMDDADLTASFAAFASQDSAQAGSASFGGCEFESELDGSMAADDEIFQEGRAAGPDDVRLRRRYRRVLLGRHPQRCPGRDPGRRVPGLLALRRLGRRHHAADQRRRQLRLRAGLGGRRRRSEPVRGPAQLAGERRSRRLGGRSRGQAHRARRGDGRRSQLRRRRRTSPEPTRVSAGPRWPPRSRSASGTGSSPPTATPPDSPRPSSTPPRAAPP